MGLSAQVPLTHTTDATDGRVTNGVGTRHRAEGTPISAPGVGGLGEPHPSTLPSLLPVPPWIHQQTISSVSTHGTDGCRPESEVRGCLTGVLTQGTGHGDKAEAGARADLRSGTDLGPRRPGHLATNLPESTGADVLPTSMLCLSNGQNGIYNRIILSPPSFGRSFQDLYLHGLFRSISSIFLFILLFLKAPLPYSETFIQKLKHFILM